MVRVLVTQNKEKFESTKMQLQEIYKFVKSKEEFFKDQIIHEDETNYGKAAVLIPVIINLRNEIEVLCTVRHRKVAMYDGEVCLPGGKVDKEDKTVCDTALRESFEEIGLHPSNVEIITVLPAYAKRKGKRYKVSSVIGIIKNSFYAKLNPDEVIDVFTVSLKRFLDPPYYMSSWKTNCIQEVGIVTQQSYKLLGFTYFLLVVHFVFIYGQLPHKNVLNQYTEKYLKIFESVVNCKGFSNISSKL